MNWKKLFPLLMISVAHADWHRQVFCDEINKFRSCPADYLLEHPDIRPRCSKTLNRQYSPLHVSQLLEDSSYFHADTSSSAQCPIVSHNTCPLYCDRFKSCSFLDRIAWFLHGTNYSNTIEIMILGPKNPYKIFHEFLHSEKHCNHILNEEINSIGCSFVHTDKNIFVADFAYL